MTRWGTPVSPATISKTVQRLPCGGRSRIPRLDGDVGLGLACARGRCYFLLGHRVGDVAGHFSVDPGRVGSGADPALGDVPVVTVAGFEARWPHHST